MDEEHGSDCNCGGEEFMHWVEATAADLVRISDGTPMEGAMIDAMLAVENGEDPRVMKMAYLIKTAKHSDGFDSKLKDELFTWGFVAQAVVRMLDERVEVTH